MNTYLLDNNFHLTSKFQKNHHLSLVRKSEFEAQFQKMVTEQSLWLTKDDSFRSFFKLSFVNHEIFRQQSFLKRYANLIIFGKIDNSLKLQLSLMFKNLIVASVDASLPIEEMIEVFNSKQPENYVISCEVNLDTKFLILARGNLEKLVIPFSAFQKSGDGIEPNFKKFKVIDHGQTIALGSYEASVDSLLYEFDPDYRKQQKKERSKNDKTFGACLRRLRLQKGIRQNEFPDINEREIGRIERGEVDQPRRSTLEKIASRLDVDPEDILSY